MLGTYVYYNLKIVETTLSSFAFFRYKYMFPPKTKAHLKLKLVCFECEKTRNLLKEISGLNPLITLTRPTNNKTEIFVSYTLYYIVRKKLFFPELIRTKKFFPQSKKAYLTNSRSDRHLSFFKIHKCFPQVHYSHKSQSR